MLYKTRLKCLLRDKTLLFWTMLFPVLISTLFYFAFSNLSSIDSYNTINIAIVDVNNIPVEFVSAIKTVKFGSERNMFNVTESEKEQADELLNKNIITGYIELEEEGIVLTIKNSGLNATILKTFLDEYVQSSSIINSVITKSQGAVDINTLIEEISNQRQYLNYQTGTNEPNLTLLYFYSLLAMTIINGSFWGAQEITNLQPNLSVKGIRMSISPTKRFILLISNIMAAFTVHMIEIALFLLYIILILGVAIGSNILYVILLCALGSFMGIAFGAFLSISLKKVSEGVKIGICTSIGVFGAMLSGMMYPNIKYWINTKAPILGIINPVNIITDGFYSLYYYTNLNRYYQNIIILSIMLVLFVSLTYVQFRRDNYDSI